MTRMMDILPVWQLTPVYPVTHVHVNPFTLLTQVAPFIHGFGEQLLMSSK